VTTFLKHTV